MANIAVVFVNYGPYHLARVEAFHHLCDQHGWHVSGVELARSQSTYAWEVDPNESDIELLSIAKETPLETLPKYKLISKLFSTLKFLNPDAIAIAGYSDLAMLATVIWGRLHGKSLVLMSASKEDDFPRVPIVERVKILLLKLFQAALVGGKPQKRYLLKLGKRPESVFLGYNVVGNDTFAPDTIRQLPAPLEKPFFLSINRFVEKKNLPLLLEAYAMYREQVGPQSWDLVFAGDGELRPSLEQKIRELNLETAVHLTGFLQQPDLLPYLAHASCFVHSSIQEQWGLVVNEAMAAGLPVLVSNRCGCFEDLVVKGINGYGFDPLNVDELAALMLMISSRDTDAKQMGKAAYEHIQKYSPDYFAKGLKQAVDYALTH